MSFESESEMYEQIKDSLVDQEFEYDDIVGTVEFRVRSVEFLRSQPDKGNTYTIRLSYLYGIDISDETINFQIVNSRQNGDLYFEEIEFQDQELIGMPETDYIRSYLEAAI